MGIPVAQLCGLLKCKSLKCRQRAPERCSLIQFYFDSATGKAGEWESWRSGKKVPDEEAVEAMMRWLAVSAGALLVLVGSSRQLCLVSTLRLVHHERFGICHHHHPPPPQVLELRYGSAGSAVRLALSSLYFCNTLAGTDRRRRRAQFPRFMHPAPPCARRTGQEGHAGAGTKAILCSTLRGWVSDAQNAPAGD